ncbi:hypothetical protein A33M_3853 [Rhodovulum sp. PH10]|nr:hypothetical protein A33M_3853 [Rhodovulum sp. PH10]
MSSRYSPLARAVKTSECVVSRETRPFRCRFRAGLGTARSRPLRPPSQSAGKALSDP